MGGSIGVLYYNKEYKKFNIKQELKSELISLSKSKTTVKKKIRRDTPYPFDYTLVQSDYIHLDVIITCSISDKKFKTKISYLFKIILF